MIITITRTVILYIFVTLGIRFMGKRQVGEMQPNELVVTLLISEIAVIPLQDTSQPILDGVVAIFMLVILEIQEFQNQIICQKDAYFSIRNMAFDWELTKSWLRYIRELVNL